MPNPEYIKFLIITTIIVQLVSTLTAIVSWVKVRAHSLLWIAIYLAIEFSRSSIGYIMALNSINNHGFFLYSGLLTQIAFLFFSLSILKDEKLRQLTKWAFGLTLSAFILLEIFQLPINVRTIFEFPFIFEIVTGIIILSDRVYHHEGKRFKEDPWSVLALLIVLTQSISMLCLISFYFFTYKWQFDPILNVLLSINVLSVLVRNSFITALLWKLRISS